jgi:hypothetical protein
MEKNDLAKAEAIIDNLFELRDQLIQITPQLSTIKSFIKIYAKTIDEVPDSEKAIFSIIENPINGILSLNNSNIDFHSISGATGSFYAGIHETRNIVSMYGSNHSDLIYEFENINKTEDLIDEILSNISKFKPVIKKFKPYEVLTDAKVSFENWKTNAISNSDLAKDIRAFQDIFKGCLKISCEITGKNMGAKLKWNKMAEILGKKNNGCVNQLIKLKSVEDEYHNTFSQVLKKTKEISKEEMGKNFNGYIEHLYSIINLIDQQIMR